MLNKIDEKKERFLVDYYQTSIVQNNNNKKSFFAFLSEMHSVDDLENISHVIQQLDTYDIKTKNECDMIAELDVISRVFDNENLDLAKLSFAKLSERVCEFEKQTSTEIVNCDAKRTTVLSSVLASCFENYMNGSSSDAIYYAFRALYLISTTKQSVPSWLKFVIEDTSKALKTNDINKIKEEVEKPCDSRKIGF